jgi:lipopolysaccharide/colanic/teichoic acid biosynthesis glycosyltransferase
MGGCDMKRLLDIVCSFSALLVLAPLLVPVMIILRFTGEGEIFYRQNRVCRGGRIFGLYKFATMLKNSPNIGIGLYTTKGDDRVLPFGRFLRATKINELPQLLNILFGDMSIIGPRPLVKSQFDLYSEEVKREIGKVRPGLSGVGSIIFRDEITLVTNTTKSHAQCYAEDITPYKGALELWYIKRQSVQLDILLICLTISAVLFPESNLHLKLLKDLPKPPTALEGFV